MNLPWSKSNAEPQTPQDDERDRRKTICLGKEVADGY